MAASEFLRQEFAPGETRTTVRADASYTGLYLYGIHTYCEFLDARRDRRLVPGASGLALGVDRIHDLGVAAAGAPAEFPDPPPLITREFDGRAVPWFFMATPRSFPLGDPGGFSMWLMEYHSHFLAEWRPPPAVTPPGVTRRDVLQRYVAACAPGPAAALLQDVTGLTIALDPVRLAALVTLATSWGYQVRPGSRSTLLEGPDLTLQVVEAAAAHARGIRSVTLRLDPSASRATRYRVGATEITIPGDGTATWTF